MVLSPDGAVLLLIDLQERLMPVIADHEVVVARAVRLAEAATLLDVPVRATEQNPAGLVALGAARPTRGRRTAAAAATPTSPRSEPGHTWPASGGTPARQPGNGGRLAFAERRRPSSIQAGMASGSAPA